MSDTKNMLNGTAIMKGAEDCGDNYVQGYINIHKKEIDNDYILNNFWEVIMDNLVYSNNYSILYVGCGTAGFLKLMKNVKKFRGIDYSAKMIEAAKQFSSTLPFYTDYYCGTFDSYSDLEAFDIVVLMVYGIYVPYTKEVLHKAKERLKAGGYILCPVPDPAFTTKSRFKEMIKTFLTKLSFKYDPLQEAEKLFESCGLKIYGKMHIKTSYCRMYILKNA